MRDRKAEAHAAGGPVPRVVHAKEGLEDPAERIFRDAGPVIPRGNARVAFVRAKDVSTVESCGLCWIAFRTTFSTVRRRSSRSP
jgi:hypothetical protein